MISDQPHDIIPRPLQLLLSLHRIKYYGVNENTSEREQTKAQDWDLIMTEPRRAWWDLRVGQLWRYRDLISNAVCMAGLCLQLVGTPLLGPSWYLIRARSPPLSCPTVIFGGIAQACPPMRLPSFLFYLSGTVIWTYFADCLKRASNTFRKQCRTFSAKSIFRV